MADDPGVKVITVVVLPPGQLLHSFVTVVTLYSVAVIDSTGVSSPSLGFDVSVTPVDGVDFVITVVERPPRHSGQGTVRVVTLVSVTVVDP